MKVNGLKRLLLVAAVALAGVLSPCDVSPKSVGKSGEKKFTLCLDPGHGGKDFGCIGSKTNEKTIVLRVATRVKKLVEKHLADYADVVMTRDGDYFVTLQGAPTSPTRPTATCLSPSMSTRWPRATSGARP